MKKTALLLGGLLLSAFVASSASAEVVRVRVTARVTSVDDPSSALAGKIVLGQRVNGLYFYNTNTPNQAPFPGLGDYRPYANEARVRFAIGSLVFESKQPTQGIGILVGQSGQFTIISNDNKPLADATQVTSIYMDLNNRATPTNSVALPTEAPDLSQYSSKEVWISANGPAGGYTVRAQLEVAELVETNAIVVSPASGKFAANQHFDAAVILPRNSVVSSAQATANGVPLPLAYPGQCQFQPQVGTGKPSLLCPNADSLLTLQPGAPIEWTVQLTNGTTYTETVTWERAP